MDDTGSQRSTKPPQPKGVIFIIECDFSHHYIEETSRPLYRDEHEISVRKQDVNSFIAAHIREHTHITK